MKHTKGPWRVDGVGVVSAKGELVAGVYRAFMGTDTQADDNARLIAAAPTMYDALDIIANNLVENGSREQLENQLQFAIITARQALAPQPERTK